MGKPILEAVLDAMDNDDPRWKAKFDAARSEASELRRELKQVSCDLGQALEIGDAIKAAVRAMKPPAMWKPSTSKAHKPAASILVMVSDWHCGEKTDPRETDGWGSYNMAISEARCQRYLDCLSRWISIQRGGYDISSIRVVVLGDLISGDIHFELTSTNEAPPPVQAIFAGRNLASLCRGLAPLAPMVIVDEIGGSNHDRLTKKYQFKQGTLNSYDFVAYEYCNALLRDCKTIQCINHRSIKQLLDIDGFKFLAGHGHWVRAWMGIPWYGIERDMSKEARRRMAKLMEWLRQQREDESESFGYDYSLGGHWHTPFVGPNYQFLCNGSLSGTNEFDHAAGRHAPPQQVAAMVSPHHGLFGPVAWRLDSCDEKELIAVDPSQYIGATNED